MNGKIPSAITGIKLNRATFSNVPINGLTFVNFFYGNNGAGKSSIAHAIEEEDGITWADGKTAADYDVLVYNQDYINRNFINYPKSCRLRLIFSYARSPGFRSFLGLYFAGFSISIGIVRMFRFVFIVYLQYKKPVKITAKIKMVKTSTIQETS